MYLTLPSPNVLAYDRRLFCFGVHLDDVCCVVIIMVSVMVMIIKNCFATYVFCIMIMAMLMNPTKSPISCWRLEHLSDQKVNILEGVETCRTFTWVIAPFKEWTSLKFNFLNMNSKIGSCEKD